MSFNELNNCLKAFNFNLQQAEKAALMKRIDANGDNQISKQEFLQALSAAGAISSVRVRQPSQASFADEERRIDQILLKIKSGSAGYKSLSEYCMALIRKMDTNKDGLLSV